MRFSNGIRDPLQLGRGRAMGHTGRGSQTAHRRSGAYCRLKPSIAYPIGDVALVLGRNAGGGSAGPLWGAAVAEHWQGGVDDLRRTDFGMSGGAHQTLLYLGRWCYELPRLAARRRFAKRGTSAYVRLGPRSAIAS